MQALEQKPELCWFIEDKKSNVQGAKLAGLRAHHFTGITALKAEANYQGFEL